MGFFINIVGSGHWLVPISWEEHRYRQQQKKVV